MDEFELIRALWSDVKSNSPNVILGIGDDAAIVQLPPQSQLVISTDSCIEGVHFFPDTRAHIVARRALMRAFSDVAAMGATPNWFTLALTTPHGDWNWLKAFRDELLAQAQTISAQLIGGDMSQGPLAIQITAMGSVPTGKALLRSNAKIDDLIVVSGALGGMGAYLQDRSDVFQSYYDAPNARIALGQVINSIAHACIDISDGFIQDLNHLLTASKVGATIELAKIPIIPNGNLDHALFGGEDYELCFTIPKDHHAQLDHIAKNINLPLTIVGVIEPELGLRAVNQAAEPVEIKIKGFRHYRETNS